MSMVSFVVPAWNEEKGIATALRSLHASARALNVDYEIIVADDASDDRTAQLAREHGARVETNRKRQIAGTRNAGARVARGDILVFVDADTQINPEVLQAAVNAVAKGAVGGGAAVEFDDVPRYARILLPLFSWLYRKSGMAAGCFVFCRRAVFEEVGGFDERYYAGEECVLSARLWRKGRFVVLRETVLTSGRKLRMFSGWEYLRMFYHLVTRTPRNPKCKGLDFWYAPRPHDPSALGPAKES